MYTTYVGETEVRWQLYLLYRFIVLIYVEIFRTDSRVCLVSDRWSPQTNARLQFFWLEGLLMYIYMYIYMYKYMYTYMYKFFYFDFK